MAQARATHKPAGKVPVRRDRTTPVRERGAPAVHHTTAVDATDKLADELLESVEKGQREAIEAVRKFVDTVDRALPALPHGEGPSRRREIVDSALDMADRLVHTQYDFIRKVIDSTAKSLNRSDDTK